MKKIPMKGEEFVKKILAGERDFSGIKLEGGFDLTPYIPEINHYLKGENLASYPVYLALSEMISLKAEGLYLPHVRAEKVDLEGANLKGANLREADFMKANLKGADLSGANLEETNLIQADLVYADLSGANLERACIKEANLWETCLKEANLKRANLEKANLYSTNLKRADLKGAYLWGANFVGADLRGVRNLENASYLLDAHFGETKVTEKEEAIIEEALRNRLSLIWHTE